MSKLQTLYSEWTDTVEDTREIEDSCNAIEEFLEPILGKEDFGKAFDLILIFGSEERRQGFMGGLQTATSIWKECN